MKAYKTTPSIFRAFLLGLLFFAPVGLLLAQNSNGGFDTLKQAEKAHVAGEYDDASHLYQQAIDSGDLSTEQTANAYHNLSGVQLALGRTNAAITSSEIAIGLKPEFPEAHFGLGNGYSKQREFQLAIQEFTKAIEQRADYAEAYFNRGNCHDDLAEYDKACADLRKALEIVPGYTRAAYNLRLVEAKKAKAEAAVNAAGNQPTEDADEPVVGMSYEKLKTICKLTYDQMGGSSGKRIILAVKGESGYDIIVENDEITMVRKSTR